MYHQYVVRVPDRDGTQAHLTAHGIGTAVYCPVPFHRQECFAHLVTPGAAFPNAEAAADEVLALPIFPELTREQQEHVVSAVVERLR